MKFICVPQNIYIAKIYSMITTIVYMIFVVYSTVSYAVWFDGISSPEVVRYKIQALNDAFQDLTQGTKPLVDGITSEKVWHDWEDTRPLTEQQYIKIAKFYQFENSPTLLAKSFSKSENKNTPQNSFDFLAYVFLDSNNKSKYIKEFENKLIGKGNQDIENQPTVFEMVNEAAKYTETHKDGSKLKYAIRELRKNIEMLQFDYVLKYAMAQSDMDHVKHNILTEGTESVKQYSLVDKMNFYANEDYSFLTNKKILSAIINLLKQTAQDNKGLLKDLQQIDNIDNLLASNQYITQLQIILNNISHKKKDSKVYTPILSDYFRNKKINEKNQIASRLLPFRETLCTNNSYFLSNILNNFITPRASKQNLYSFTSTPGLLTWYKGSRLHGNFSRNLGGYNFKYYVQNKIYSNILIAGIENHFNKTYTVGILYGYTNSNMTQKLENKKINNKSNINNNFIVAYGCVLINDYYLKFYANYNVSQNNSTRTDSQDKNYNISSECHSISLFAEASVKMATYHKLFIEPSIILKSYMHPEHSYAEYSDHVIHKLIPLSIVAKHYQNIDLGAKLAFHSSSKGDEDEIVTTLWFSALQDIMKHNPEFLIGINDSKVLFSNYSHDKRKYEIGLAISWIKNKLSANFDIWSKYSKKENTSCLGLEIKYKL